MRGHQSHALPTDVLLRAGSASLFTIEALAYLN